jgi:hypothetical protein
MPVTHRIEERLVTIELQGGLSMAELLQAVQDLQALEASLDPTPDRLILVDAITTFEFNFDRMETLGEMRRKVVIRNPVRSAIVAGNDLQYGMARMFQSLNSHPNITVEVFRQESQARLWLGVIDKDQRVI